MASIQVPPVHCRKEECDDSIVKLEVSLGFQISMSIYSHSEEAPRNCNDLAKACMQTAGLDPHTDKGLFSLL